MEEWKEYRLGEIGTIVGGATPSTKDVSNYDGNISWLTPKDLSIHTERYIKRGERMISLKGYNSCSCKMLPKGSILFSSRAPIGYVAIASKELCTNQGFKSIIPFKEKVDSLFLYYLLIYNRKKIEGLGSGTTFKEVSLKVMQNVKVSIPSLTVQQNIASILSSLDSKIEINNKINSNLEEQAKALFKSWFIDFEPFKDEKFVDSELGMIPEGWKVVTIGEVTDNIKEKVGDRDSIKVLSPVSSGHLVLSEEYFSKQVFSSSIAKYIVVKHNDFAYNPARINIGSIGMNEFEFDGCVSPVYVVFRCQSGYEYFFDLYRRTSYFIEEVKKRAIGGVRQTLSYKDLSLIQLIYPPKKVVDAFNFIYISFIHGIHSNDVSNKKLEAIRNTLLPKLMSGELDVK